MLTVDHFPKIVAGSRIRNNQQQINNSYEMAKKRSHSHPDKMKENNGGP